MTLREQRHHLFYLHDLLGRAAEKAEQRLPQRLTQNAQTRKSHEAAGEVWITAPRERVDERVMIKIEAEIARQSHRGGGVVGGWGAPFELIMIEP